MNRRARQVSFWGRIHRHLMAGAMILAILPEIGLAKEVPPVDIQLLGANPVADRLAPEDPQPTSLFLGGTHAAFTSAHGTETLSPAATFQHVYPGISLAYFADDHHLEFAFVLMQGADPTLIRFLVEGATLETYTPDGHIVYLADGFEIYQHAPVIRQQQAETGSMQALAANYQLPGASETRIASPTLHQELTRRLNHSHFNVVPTDVGTEGPDYDFYMARYEVTNHQWVRFLNDAQQNPNNARGDNLYFDAKGNVWFHPDMQPGRDEIFLIDTETIHYNPDRIRGDRYSLASDAEGRVVSEDHPATGISWFGALKYCNWLTLESGRGLDQRAYREGTNQFEWAPVTATNWGNGAFTIAERREWIDLQGFRLPMFKLQEDRTRYPTNAFNEFYKAAAWNGQTNTLYGYGRNTFATNDAVVLDTVLRQGVGIMPVGYFDGINRLPAGPTRPNENGFGIHDLTGNVSEWLNDFPRRGMNDARLLAGGSFEDPLRPVSEARMVAPHTSGPTGGFRPVTTYMPESITYLNVLFCFHTTNQIPDELREKFGLPSADDPPDPLRDPPGLIPDPTVAPGPPEEAIIPPDVEPPDPDDPFEETALPQPPGILLQETETVLAPPSPPGPPTPGTPGVPGFPGDPDDPGPPPPLLALQLQSQNPASGVPIGVTLPDFYGYTDGSTTFTRFYAPGARVTLSAPPTVGNNTFQHWLRNGVRFSLSTTITVDMLSDLTFTAVYLVPQPPPQRQLNITSTPVSGVPISLSHTDNNGLRDGTTAFSRTYDLGQQVTVTAPPEANGEPFLGWLRNGQPFSNNRTVSVTLFNDTTLTAQYGQAVQTEERRLSVNSQNPDSDVPITLSVADNNGLQDGLTSLNRLFDFGTDLVVTAPPSAPNGNTFIGWFRNGVLVSTDPALPVSMITDVILTARYQSPPPDIILTVGSDRPNSGVDMLVSTPDNDGLTDGTTTFTRRYTEGASTTVTAPPVAPNGNEFRRWLLNGSPLTTNLTASVNLLADSQLIAVYRPPDPPPRIYDLQVRSLDPDSGVDIAISVPDINNASDGSTAFTRSYLEDTSVTLTAPPIAPDGNVFVRWLVDGIPYSDQNSISLIMTGNRIVTAVYEPPPPQIRYTLEVESRNPNSLVAVTVMPTDVNGSPSTQTTPFDRLYDAGTVVTITARNPAFPGSSIYLQQWLLDGVPYSTNATIQVTMLADRRVTAVYGPPLEPDTHVLTVISVNPDQNVPIAVSIPDINNDIDGSTTFERVYNTGDDVTLTAPANAPNGNRFLHWLYDGILLSTNASITVSMLDDVTVTAVYEDLPPIRNLAVRSQNPASGVLVDLDVADIHDNQSGTTAFDRQYFEGQNVTLTATPLAPNGHDVFVRWERDGVPVSTNTTTSITLYQDTVMTAIYEPPPTVTLRVRSENPDRNVPISISEPDNLNRTDGTTAFDRIYDPGTTTTVTAPLTAPDGAPFVEWLLNGVPFSTDPQITLEMLGDLEVTAVFGEPPPPPRALAVRSVNPDSDVLISVTPPDRLNRTDGLTSFRRLYDDGELVTLEAPPTAGTNDFRQWILNGVPITTNLSTTVLMSQDHELIAVYGPPVEPQQRVLTVDSRDPFSGVPIEVSTPDISGDTDGTTVFVRIYEYGDLTTLTAPDTAGTNDYVFLYWERDGQQFSNDQSVTVEMLTDIRMTAVYGPFVPDVTLTVESQNPDSGVTITVAPADLDSLTTGTTTFERTYEVGQNVTLSAPDEANGQPFLRWLFNGTPISTNNVVQIELLDDVTMTAVYGDPEPEEPVRLTVASEGPDGPIITLINATPDNNGNSSGSTVFQRIYDYADEVTLTAPATSNGFGFSHWVIGGAIIGNNRTITLSMLADTIITAVYVEPPPSPSGL